MAALSGTGAARSQVLLSPAAPRGAGGGVGGGAGGGGMGAEISDAFPAGAAGGTGAADAGDSTGGAGAHSSQFSHAMAAEAGGGSTRASKPAAGPDIGGPAGQGTGAPGAASSSDNAAPASGAAATSAAEAAADAEANDALAGSADGASQSGTIVGIGRDTGDSRAHGRSGRADGQDSSASQGLSPDALALLLASAGVACAAGASTVTGAHTRGADAADGGDEDGICAVGSRVGGRAGGASLMAAREILAADAAASGNVVQSATGGEHNSAAATAGGGSANGAPGAGGALANVAAGAARAAQGAWAGLLAGGSGADAGSGASLNSGGDAGRTTAGGTADAATASPGATTLSPLLAQSLSSAGAAAASMTRGLPVPVTDPGWPRALAAQVQWMAGAQVQSATLRLSPPHLGALEVRIDLQSSHQINVTFTASHPDTRTALADAVPQLRALFAAGGLSLGQATVQQESGSNASGSSAVPARRSGTVAAAESVEPVALGVTGALGLVDEYV